MKPITLYFLLAFLFAETCSCNRYIDNTTTERKIPIMQGSFTFYPKSNDLVYKSNIGLRRDTESRNPKSFYLKVPKRLKWYQIENSESFVFNYKDKQVIAIYIDLFGDLSMKDTAYTANIQDVERLRPHFGADKNKYNLWNIPMIDGRKQYLLQKGNATILLYNILPSNYNHFIATVNSFKFL